MYSLPACVRIRAEPNEKHAGEYRFCTMRVLQEKLRKYGIKAVTAHSMCIIAPIFLFCKSGYSI